MHLRIIPIVIELIEPLLRLSVFKGNGVKEPPEQGLPVRIDVHLAPLDGELWGFAVALGYNDFRHVSIFLDYQDNKTMIDPDNNDGVLTHAELANAAYLQSPEVEGWVRDMELSSRDRSVYTKDGKAVVAYAGTRLYNKKDRVRDLAVDAAISLGLGHLTARFRDGAKLAQQTAAKYGKENVTLTGHSMGGSTALYSNSRTGLETHAFNPGVAPADVQRNGFEPINILKIWKQPRVNSNAHSYITKGDLVGALSPFVRGLNTHIVPRKRGVNAHSLIHFRR